MYCENCGKEIKDGAKFCPYCGARQGETEAPAVNPAQAVEPTMQAAPAPTTVATVTPQSKRKRGPIVLLVVLVLLAALAAVGCLVVLPRWKAQKQAEYLVQANEAIDAQDYAAAEEALAQAEKVLSDGKTELMAAQLAIEQGNYEDAVQKYQAISEKTLQSYTPAKGELEKIEACRTDDERTNANQARRQEASVYLAAAEEYNYKKNWLYTYSYSDNQETVEKYSKGGKMCDVREAIYNEDEKVLYTTNPNGVETARWEYYDSGKLKSKKRWMGEETQYLCEYNEAGAKTGYAWYDEDGNLTSRGVCSNHDAHGNYTHSTWYDSDGNTGEYTYAYTYDTDGRMLTKECYDADGTKRYKNSWNYDENGNVIAYFSFDENDVLDYAYTYTYTYDADGHKTSETEYDEDGDIKNAYTYTYDANGHKTSQTYYEDGNIYGKYIWMNGLMTEYINYDDDGTERSHYYYYYAQKNQLPGEVSPMVYTGMPDY